ncbi:major facilitator superfamily domain-containing protein [Biscogniauxia mediterranea]|nr:major facilitator superfamily domain-containing protein [Biscogniauxia mediterranea]
MAGDETTPLLRSETSANPSQPKPTKAKTKTKTAANTVFGPANRILFAGFLMSFTLGITQVPIIYVFRLMECDIFWSHHGPFEGPGDRCHRREINAGTATQVSIVGMSTSFSGVFNLFICGYFIKIWGPRWAFVSQTALLGLRVSTQILGVTIGGRAGEIIFQAFQAIGIIGGPRGYQLVLNTAVSELVAAKDRTAVFGRLQGSIMLGTAFGYLLGGVLGDVYNIRRPFETAFFLYIVSTIYGALFMPTGSGNETSGQKQGGRGLSAFFAPIKVIVPHRYRLESGKIIKNYGLVFLAIGIFLGVFASGYAPVLLQMYATSEFDFGTTENGYLMFGNSLIRGLFLLFMFPKIISAGRDWFNGTPVEESTKQEPGSHIPINPEDFEAAEGDEVPQEPTRILDPDEEDSGTGFDLFFVRWSLVIDSLVTFFAAFSSKGWQVYLAGFLLPFASGSAPAAKGVMTEMCPPHQRPDAISAITLVESTATLLTQGLFGLVFAAFSEMGRPSLTFFCNAGFAVLGFTVLFLARFPPENSKRIDENESESVTEAETHPSSSVGTIREPSEGGAEEEEGEEQPR